MKQTLGERMKFNYEQCWNIRLPFRLPVIIRLDGKNFHAFTRKMKRPFDEQFTESMMQLTMYLCQQVHTTVFAYSQSDEISLLLHPYKKLDTEPYFLNEIQKVVSIVAATASSFFTRRYDKEVIFDARCFVLPEDEVCNYYLWRQQDRTRNSINMLAQSKFSHKQLQGKSTKEMQEMMFAKDKTNWNDLETYKKRGFAVYKERLAVKKSILALLRGEEGKLQLGGQRVDVWKLDSDIPLFNRDRHYIEQWLATDSDGELTTNV